MDGTNTFDPDRRPHRFDYLHDKKLIEVERAFLRKRPGRTANGQYVGLALSGGGIRSASFALGLLQALARNDRLKEIDYLSTVSGGGYIGSSLTWFLHRRWVYSREEPGLAFGVGPDDFPFGTAKDPREAPGVESREKRSILRHLRQNMNYLFPGDGIGPMALVAALVRGVALNLLVYGPLLVGSLILLALAGEQLPLGDAEENQMAYLRNWLAVAGLFALALLITAPIYGWATYLVHSRARVVYSLHRNYLHFAGGLWIAIGLFTLVGLLPLLSNVGWMTGPGLAAVGFLSSIWAQIRFVTPKPRSIRIPTGILIGVAASFLIVGLFVLGYAAADRIVESVVNRWEEGGAGLVWLYALVLLTIGIATGFLTNINLVTLHRYYRDRLMELFMPEPAEATIDSPAKEARLADSTTLHTMCNYWAEGVGPYHLINANVLLCGSKITKFRGRGGDSFVLSPLYCGSNATGWVRTDRFVGGKFTLATGMAVSGAAISAHAGAAGEGPPRNPLLGALMALLNIRLGVWVENPRHTRESDGIRSGRAANLWEPGLREILFPRSMSEETRFVELTDGGHFENLAVYELVRRELDVIIVCDGVADRECRFSDFSNLVEKVRLDFNATIEIDLDPLIPKTGDDHPYGIEMLSKASHAFGTITYSNGKRGLIVYLGTTLIPGLPADLYGYKLSHDDFPDEATSDQIFGEKQFEAYRELGAQLGQRMISSIDVNRHRIWPPQ